MFTESRRHIVNKYSYVYVVQGWYGCGWEDLCESESYKESRAWLHDYARNETLYHHRLIQRRILNSEEK
jgi:hypothetical protein